MPAADLNWDPKNAVKPASGGDGNWNTTNTVWSTGAADVVWKNAGQNGTTPDTALFANSPGTVTIAAPITVKAIRFGANGYVRLTGNNAITLSDTPSTTVSVGKGQSATINAELTGNVGLFKGGPGELGSRSPV